jgi:hypothetical protein
MSWKPAFAARNKNKTIDLAEATEFAKKHGLQIQLRHGFPHLIVGNKALNLLSSKNFEKMNQLYEFFKDGKGD